MSEPVIIGCDTSTSKIALTATVGNEWINMFRFLLPTTDKVRAVKFIEAWMCKIVLQMKIVGDVHVFIEYPPFIRNPKTVIDLARVMAAVEAGAWRGGAVAVTEVPPSLWKMTVMGKGHGGANKAEVTTWMSLHWPEAYREATKRRLSGGVDQDLIDSAAINRHGKIITARSNMIKKNRRMRSVE